MYFRNSNICSNKLDVQTANLSMSVLRNQRFFLLDAGLRMVGIPALSLWDVVMDVLHLSNNVPPTHG